MAVKRTGTKKTAKRLHPAPLGLLGKGLATIGRPFFWLGLGLVWLLIFLLSSAQKIFIKTGETFIWLPKEFLRIAFLFLSILPRITIKLFSIVISCLLFVFLILWRFLLRLFRSTWRFFGLKIPLSRPRKRWFLAIAITCLSALACLSVYFYVLKDLPHPDRLASQPQALSTKIYDRQGGLLYNIYDHQNRTLVKLEEIPLSLIQATIAIEDAEFYRHPGFSFKGIFRALLQDLRGGKLYGGSTITQQLIKNSLLTPERTLRRKIKELVLALWVEQKFSKDEILQMYFNEVGYGGAAYGVEGAAQMHFGKSVRDLNLAEASLLAGLPASPTTFSPFGAYP